MNHNDNPKRKTDPYAALAVISMVALAIYTSIGLS